MNTEEEAKQKLASKEWRMNFLYKIQTKDSRLKTFKRNSAQKNYNESKGKKNQILKARQLGFSTDCLLDMLDETLSHPNTTSAVVAHEQKKVQTLFEIVKRAYDNFPKELKPRVSFDNRNELYFPDIDSKIFVTLDTRGETVHNLHVSEVAFIKRASEKMTGILESVPSNGRITLESTANGVGGYFYEEWENEQSEFKKHFYSWIWDVDYRERTDKTSEELDKIYFDLAVRYGTIPGIKEKLNISDTQFQWYISKVIRHREFVMQEYPSTALEAFISSGRNVFSITDLQKHSVIAPLERKWGTGLLWEFPLKGFKYVVGVDVAEGIGSDRSVIEVFNAHTGEQVFEYASDSIKPDLLGRMAVEVAKYFNTALLVIESNNHGRSTLDTAKKIYYNLYSREVFDKVTQKKTNTLGWNTNGTSKPRLVDQLEEATREKNIEIHSYDAIKEMKVFVQTEEQGKQGFGAEGNAHDDRVIAMGLCIQGMKWMPRAPKAKTIAQIKLEEFIKKHGEPPDIFKGNNLSVTSRHRKNYFIRK